MKKNRLAAGAFALAVSVTACGCGDQVYEMTKEEEAVIVQYSAHAVSKFNKRQTEGVEDVTALKAMMKQEEEEAEEKRRQQEQEQEQEEQQEQAKPDKQPDSAVQNGQNAQQPDTPSYVSLTRALGLNGISASYRKYELVSAYQASQSYMVRANSGNELLVLHINLKNNTNKTTECDILSKMPSFALTINGEVRVSADTTILLNDLGTYQGRLKAGEKAKTVLIFQVKKGSVKSIDSMELEVTSGGEASQVKLLG